MTAAVTRLLLLLVRSLLLLLALLILLLLLRLAWPACQALHVLHELSCSSPALRGHNH
jgi:hypothetical protein